MTLGRRKSSKSSRLTSLIFIVRVRLEILEFALCIQLRHCSVSLHTISLLATALIILLTKIDFNLVRLKFYFFAISSLRNAFYMIRWFSVTIFSFELQKYVGLFVHKTWNLTTLDVSTLANKKIQPFQLKKTYLVLIFNIVASYPEFSGLVPKFQCFVPCPEHTPLGTLIVSDLIRTLNFFCYSENITCNKHKPRRTWFRKSREGLYIMLLLQKQSTVSVILL